ncbi:MAG TPA: NADH-quinone oxidoreductase subunit NuoK [Euryarchaeota archaeon]|nr:NADH-quinone oxidoreductase subunit K [archaeon BMS3Bbin15]HDL14847.1 NADH-quinone oxidoreductase subunit NuoK [Euryarchaeota archaeon]
MTEVTVFYYLVLSVVIFSIGAYGMLSSKNGVRLLMSIEIMLNAVNINLVAFSSFQGNLTGQVFAAFTIAIAAAEATVGLAILLALYRSFGTVNLRKISKMRW